MKTEIRSWVPRVPVMEAGLDEHGVVPDGTIHTTPTPELVTMTVTVVVRDRVPLVPVTCAV